MKAKRFSKALMYHLQWKVLFKKFVDGKGSFKMADLSPEDSKFGQWLCSEEAARYASEKELLEIYKIHNKLCKTAKRIYFLKKLGNDVVARKELAHMEAASMKLVSLMSTLKSLNNN